MMITHSGQPTAAELIAQIMSAIRTSGFPQHTPMQKRHVFVSGDIRLDVRRRLVTIGKDAVRLTPREYDLLLMLAVADGAAVPKSYLLSEVWNNSVDSSSRTIAQHVSELRRKLEKNPSVPERILTVPKFGYRMAGQWIEDRHLRADKAGGARN